MPKNRITAGLPAVTPESRSIVDERAKTRAISRDAIVQQQRADAASVATDGGLDTTNALAQMGRPLTASQVMERLRKCNPNFWFERAIADSALMGVYVIE